MLTRSFQPAARSVVHLACCVVLLSAFPVRAAAEDFADAIHAYLRQCVECRNPHIGIVVGLVDKQGSRVVGYGKLDDETDQKVNGDTLFEIGSDTKTFTALLLQDMVERGEMRLDDPVAKYLTESVAVPTRNGKDITLRHLATHTSGLPSVPDNLDPKRADNPYADYTVEKMYAFLSHYQLPRDPGATSEYSNFGMGLLGHVIAIKAGKSFESLVVERICRPLQMESTSISLTPELKSRFATPHNQFGEPVPCWDLPTLPGAGALRSTADDLLKYLSANLDLTPSNLTPLMTQAHDLGLAWYTTTDRDGTAIISHGGGTGGCRSFPAFDKVRRRGVVVLTNSNGVLDVGDLATFLLTSEWQSNRRPTATQHSSSMYDAYTGQYQRLPDVASRMVAVRRSFLWIPDSAMYVITICGVAVLGFWLRCARTFRNRAAILVCAVLMLSLVAGARMFAPRQTIATGPEPGIGIFRMENRLFAEAMGTRSWPMKLLLPPHAGELLPLSEGRFFERLSGNPIIFSRDARGSVTGLTAWHAGEAFLYQRISDQPPPASTPRKPRVTIKLHAKILDTLVGHYSFSPSAAYPKGAKVEIWREADRLLWQEVGANAIPGAIELYPESQTSFFTKIDAVQLNFVKNANGDVTAVVLRLAGSPDLMGKRLPLVEGPRD